MNKIIRTELAFVFNTHIEGDDRPVRLRITEIA